LIANAHKYRRGKLAEDKAAEYLQQHGLREIKRNYRTKMGEIDLIMLDGDQTVFVEVRFRATTERMHAVETINKKKIRRIILASRYFLQTDQGNSGLYRFDIVAMTGNPDSPEIDWIKNAFVDEN